MNLQKMKKIVLIFTLLIVSFANIFAQVENNDIREGNRLFKEGKFQQAEVAYRRALQKNKNSFAANFNLGNALYRQKKYSNALEQYNSAVAIDKKDKIKLANAYHNIGNALLNDKKIEESITAYKNALKANPKADDTRYNLAYAQELLKKQKNNDKNKNQNKDKQQNNQQQQQQPQQQQQKMSKDNAQQILDALKQDEKNTLDKTKKQPVRAQRNSDKDW
jgi:Ca-activated chloride channel homolog